MRLHTQPFDRQLAAVVIAFAPSLLEPVLRNVVGLRIRRKSANRRNPAILSLQIAGFPPFADVRRIRSPTTLLNTGSWSQPMVKMTGLTGFYLRLRHEIGRRPYAPCRTGTPRT